MLDKIFPPTAKKCLFRYRSRSYPIVSINFNSIHCGLRKVSFKSFNFFVFLAIVLNQPCLICISSACDLADMSSALCETSLVLCYRWQLRLVSATAVAVAARFSVLFRIRIRIRNRIQITITDMSPVPSEGAIMKKRIACQESSATVPLNKGVIRSLPVFLLTLYRCTECPH